jgi:hypothetical protein
VIVAVTMPLVALAVRGIRPAGDTKRYLDGASALLAGHGLPHDAVPYAGYVAVVAGVRQLGLSMTALAVLQIACAGLAVFAVARTARDLAGPVAGALAALGLAVNVDIWSWHLYVLTDSLYVSGVALSTWLVHHAVERRRAAPALGALAAVVVAASLRPNGWLLAAAYAAYAAWRLLPRRRGLGAALVLVAACAVASQLPQLKAADNVQAVRMLREGVVNWGDRSSSLDMPGDVDRVHDASSAARYSAQEPVAVGRLVAARLATELGHVRPYYSAVHNAGIVVFLVPLYVLALVGACVTRRQPLLVLLGLAVAVHLATVGLTFADYDGRFLLYAVPALTVLAGAGAAPVVAWSVQFLRAIRAGARQAPAA